MRLRAPLAIAATLLLPAAAAGQTWRIGAALGFAYNVPVPLVIRQRGEPPIRTTARFATRAFQRPLYYLVRAERLDGDHGWGMEWIHHKLFLRNRPAEVQRFDISHGFNVVTLLYSRVDGLAEARLGAGVVISHPENTVRGRELPETSGSFGGYHLSGPAAQVGWGRLAGAGQGTAFAELKAVGAWARVPVQGGGARFWHASAHAAAGPSGSF
ncbi:MAG TPA: hypothetical protein VFQ38_12345 [Longimicrobiales bacterium]|nr:hypothetical protein [Longimicrobiales bacterium]